MGTAVANYYADESELFEWYPENPPGVPGKHKQWMGRVVTVTGWHPQWSWAGLDAEGHDLSEIHWLGYVQELGRMVPYEELLKL